MSIITYLTKKMRNPNPNHDIDKEWIKLMHYEENSDNPSAPSVYGHGGLADPQVVSPNNLQAGMVTTARVNSDKEELIINTRDE